jgi:hypothetical protein
MGSFHLSTIKTIEQIIVIAISGSVIQGALPLIVPLVTPTADCRRLEGSLFSCAKVSHQTNY